MAGTPQGSMTLNGVNLAVDTTTANMVIFKGSGHADSVSLVGGPGVNVVAYGGLHPGNPLTIPYDTGQAALVAFTEGLARHVEGTGVQVSLFCLGSASPRVGQNTRSRGIGRWIGDGSAPQEGMRAAEQLAGTLVDGLHRRRFAIAGDPADRDALDARWGHLDPKPAAAVTG